MVGYTLFATTFPSLNDPAFAAFFGFFTGVWIKPVLQALNDIGMRFLSLEEQLKIHARMTSTVVTESQPASSPPPTAAFLQAVEDARTQLLPLDGVLGVGPGERTQDGEATEEEAIVVYVDEKRDLPPDHPDFVPPMVNGYRTDVQEVPEPPSEGCFKEQLVLSSEKIASLATASLTEAVPRSGLTPVVAGAVWLLVDADRTLFWPSRREQVFFDVLSAFSTMQRVIGDAHQFVGFVIDVASGLPSDGNYCRRVFSEHPSLGYTTNLRPQWGTQSLISAQVFSRVPTLRIALHEIVHSWAAYIEIPPCNAKPARKLTGDRMHWANFIDYGSSCNNESLHVWQNAPGGRRRVKLDRESDGFGLSDLDLLLMGLLRRNDITEPVAMLNPIEQNGVHPFTGEEIAPACLPNRPRRSTTAFRQAYVVVSANEQSGGQVAAALSARLADYERNFNQACRSLASLSITRAR